MRRRTVLAGLGTAAAAGVAGCSALRSDRTLSSPAVLGDSPQRRSLSFEESGGEVGNFGVDGAVDDGVVELRTELSHRDGTRVESIELQVWMPDAPRPAQVAVVSPVTGDSSAPPELTLDHPDRGPGTVVSVTDIDDLADETITTLDLLVRPPDDPGETVLVEGTIALAGSGTFGTDYTLDGRLELSFPELAG